MIFFVRRLVDTLRREIVSTNVGPGLLDGLIRNYSYKSAYALENFYPKSNIKLFTPAFIAEESSHKFTGFIPIDKLAITYSRSSGPGGQHVNCVNTKVDLRFQVESATWLSHEIKENLLIQEKNRINKRGFLIVKSDLTRYQQLNLADALERLRAMIRKAIPLQQTVSLENEEIIRKRGMKAARERIFQKRIRSQIKRERNIGDVD